MRDPAKVSHALKWRGAGNGKVLEGDTVERAMTECTHRLQNIRKGADRPVPFLSLRAFPDIESERVPISHNRLAAKAAPPRFKI
jgi:hypothetical protein